MEIIVSAKTVIIDAEIVLVVVIRAMIIIYIFKGKQNARTSVTITKQRSILSILVNFTHHMIIYYVAFVPINPPYYP